ncbi:MAG: thiamine-phosphate kinase [Actinomycetota bacterium]|nr:thiamine-phosphate kinase [Actinomycetota bacterium]
MNPPEPGSLAELGEFALIAKVTEGLPEMSQVLVGPGDDAAVVVSAHGSVVISTDVLIEGRHFRRDWSTPIDIGRRAAAASLADIVAMGARPTAVVVGFAAPADLPSAWAVSCTAGLRAELDSLVVALVGGDVTSADTVMITVTAIGDLEGRKPVLRSGAQAGDLIAIAGRHGWAAAGLALLSRGFRSPKKLVDAHRYPLPPYGAGPLAALTGATSMIDVSDGLIADSRHIAQASDVVLAIDSSLIQVPEELASAASAYNMDPREWMLTGGDDHALLATFPKTVKVPSSFVVIGEVREVSAQGPGVLVDGHFVTGAGGHEHFRS